MMNRATKLRMRRKFRMQRRQVVTVGAQAEQQLEQHFFRRLERLGQVRRFVTAWIVLLVLLVSGVAVQTYSLSGYYQTLQPAPGGTYTEGVVGIFTNANPLYATSVADRTVSKLVFASLLTYDERNELAGDLAERWSADERGQAYTVVLREGLRWHDGKPVTADDVVFTYEVAQNPDARSPLNTSFRDVDIRAVDARTVQFTLANPLASFPHSLTTGIVPKHLLEAVPMADMRTAPFNTVNPVGAGPFRWHAVEVSGAGEAREESIAMTAYEDYYAGRPHIDSFVLRVFRTEARMQERFAAREINAMVGLSSFTEQPNAATHLYSFNQTAAMMTFFKTNSGVLANKAVRQALVRGMDTTAVREQLTYAPAPATGPLLKSQLGYDATLQQLPYNKDAANKQLDEAGWTRNTQTGMREKDGQPLAFSLFAESNAESSRVTRELQRHWRAIGVDVSVELQDGADFQATLAEHSYDALLRGISLGVDPDVFPYWHSSQADVRSQSRLNFSEYKSSVVDEALASARTRTDPALRIAKYKPFLQAWRDDAPALALYQPRFLYVTRQEIHNLNNHPINTASDRFANVHEWMIRRVKTTVD